VAILKIGEKVAYFIVVGISRECDLLPNFPYQQISMSMFRPADGAVFRNLDVAVLDAGLHQPDHPGVEIALGHLDLGIMQSLLNLLFFFLDIGPIADFRADFVNCLVGFVLVVGQLLSGRALGHH
jgi:hypothetical protein